MRVTSGANAESYHTSEPFVPIQNFTADPRPGKSRFNRPGIGLAMMLFAALTVNEFRRLSLSIRGLNTDYAGGGQFWYR
jgi:hypothetical protein